MTRAWRALLDGSDADRARARVAAIVSDVRALAEERTTLVAHELALLEAYAAGEQLERFVDESARDLREHPLRPALWGGVLGIGFVLAHLTDTELDELDEHVLEQLDQPRWSGSFDLIDGLVGIGVYARERGPRSSARACVARVVQHLNALAERRDDGITWFTSFDRLPNNENVRALYPAGQTNVGVAHGTPGVLSFLARLRDAANQPTIASATRWLLAQRFPDDGRACFPGVLAPGHDSVPPQCGWCYGDIGIATAFVACGDGELEQLALATARRVAARPVHAYGIRAPGLCHGAAGVAHMFNRIHQATGDQVFADVSRVWFRITLDAAGSGGIGGYQSTRTSDGTPMKVDDPGLLNGATGVALALHAACSTTEPAWDRLFLLS